MQTKAAPKRKAVGGFAPGAQKNMPTRKGQKKLTRKDKKEDENADDSKTRFNAKGRETHSPPWMHKDGHMRGGQKAKKGQRRGKKASGVK